MERLLGGLVSLSLIFCLMGCGHPPVSATAAPLPTAWSDSNVVSVGYQAQEEMAGQPRIQLAVSFVELRSGAAADGYWKELWGEPEEASQSKVMSSKLTTDSITNLQSQGCAYRRNLFEGTAVDDRPKIIPTPFIEAEKGFTLSSTVLPNGRVLLVFKDPVASGVTVAEVTVELSAEEALVLAGPKMTGTKTEISRTPILGDIPGIGPMFFSARKLTTETNLTLLVITAKVEDAAIVPASAQDVVE